MPYAPERLSPRQVGFLEHPVIVDLGPASRPIFDATVSVELDGAPVPFTVESWPTTDRILLIRPQLPMGGELAVRFRTDPSTTFETEVDYQDGPVDDVPPAPLAGVKLERVTQGMCGPPGIALAAVGRTESDVLYEVVPSDGSAVYLRARLPRVQDFCGTEPVGSYTVTVVDGAGNRGASVHVDYVEPPPLDTGLLSFDPSAPAARTGGCGCATAPVTSGWGWTRR